MNRHPLVPALCYNESITTRKSKGDDNNGVRKNSRMLELFFRVLRGETVSVKAVAEEYGVSTKSVGRDIAKIQEFLTDHRDLMQQAELIYSYKDKAYHLSCRRVPENKGAVRTW